MNLHYETIHPCFDDTRLARNLTNKKKCYGVVSSSDPFDPQYAVYLVEMVNDEGRACAGVFGKKYDVGSILGIVKGIGESKGNAPSSSPAPRRRRAPGAAPPQQ